MVAITSRLTAITLLALAGVAQANDLVRIKCYPVKSSLAESSESSSVSLDMTSLSLKSNEHIGFDGNTISSEEPESYESFTSSSRSVVSRTTMMQTTESGTISYASSSSASSESATPSESSSASPASPTESSSSSSASPSGSSSSSSASPSGSSNSSIASSSESSSSSSASPSGSSDSSIASSSESSSSSSASSESSNSSIASSSESNSSSSASSESSSSSLASSSESNSSSSASSESSSSSLASPSESSSSSSASSESSSSSSASSESSSSSSASSESSSSSSASSESSSSSLATSSESSSSVDSSSSSTSETKEEKKDYQLCYDKAQTYTFTNAASLSPFHVENCASDFYIKDNMLAMQLSSPNCAPTADFPQYLSQGGMWEMDAQSINANGTVTAFVIYGPGTMGHTDEVDYEWVGTDQGNVQAMYFANGKRVTGEKRIPAADGSNLSQTFHRYGIEYNKDFINWWMDGRIVRTIENDGSKPYPKDLGLMKFGVWDGSNTNGWAGTVDWTKGPLNAYIREMKFIPYC